MANHLTLLTAGFLRGVFETEYAVFKDVTDPGLLDRLRNWHERIARKETSEEQNFIRCFFQETWGYVSNGTKGPLPGFQLYPQYPVPRAGQRGGVGQADLAIAWFDYPDMPDTIQVICEFKDITSDLDSPQQRKGNDRSPVKQCADYLREVRADLLGNEPIQPQWAIVTDMNEFRLYYWGRMPGQYQRFVVSELVADNDSARFQRFLFWRLFQPDLILSSGGASRLERMLGEQWHQEHDLENTFYGHYQAFREKLYRALVAHNPSFPGTRGDLVRLSQHIVDRLIFILYCEDMGKAIDFPHNLLRDVLIQLAEPELYQADDSTAWDRLRQLFRAMASGAQFANRAINRFNGGLFMPNAEIDALALPTEVFCARGQNLDPGCAQDTLLYLSATYNFGLTSEGERSITLLTLGRIFEQSITELEIRVAEEDGRPSLGKLSKRKRDGVYYTPEWVTRFIVEETVGRRLEDIKEEIGWKDAEYLSDAEIAKKTPRYNEYLAGLRTYREHLENIRIVDPACGSGAFLIQALEYLLGERRRVTNLYNRFTRQESLFDSDQNIRSILARNIFGVDINPESVEITKLALWLHTTVPGAPLTTLDENIRCGNSLIDSEIYTWRRDLLDQLTPDEQQRINAFDWHRAFPEVFSSGGFDCVVGNPPYVKLQNFRRVEAHAAEFLLEARRADGSPYYHTTQTGNFDLYLPFIEKGLGLLNPSGRMGYIAPSVWLKNEYGIGLRSLLATTHKLERWVDFASHMVFDEAIVYTALQFFTATPNSAIRFAYAPDGAVNAADWDNPDYLFRYDELPVPSEAWNFLPSGDRALLTKLYLGSTMLVDRSGPIFQGLITSADSIYHLTRVGENTYRTSAGADVVIEEALMKPLVSGPEADRYVTPRTDTWLLFPYLVSPRDDNNTDTRLYTSQEMASEFPNGWAYLQTHERALRDRENQSFDDESWYRFGRPQNLDKQMVPKLIVAQTVPKMEVCIDADGQFFLNNVRVNGILGDVELLDLLLGILNSRAIDFVFRRIAKPKAGGYLEANKQFIAPLPIPGMAADAEQTIRVLARQLHQEHTLYRDQTLRLERRFESCQWIRRPESSLWPKLPSVSSLASSASKKLSARERGVWARSEHKRIVLEAKHTFLARLSATSRLGLSSEALASGELCLLGEGRILLQGIFFDARATLRHYWWKKIVRDRGTVSFTLRQLLSEPVTDNQALRDQVAELSDQLDSLHATIRENEEKMDALVADAFDLTRDERKYISNDPRRSWR